MSTRKSSVTVLEEFCTRNHLESPQYLYSQDGKVFVCDVTLIGIMSNGRGRSKHDAKHNAASNAMHELANKYPGISGITVTNVEEVANTDVNPVLRAYCIKQNLPKVTTNIVQETGTSDAPEFTACCKIGDKIRYGIAGNKKDAIQKALFEMLYYVYQDEFEQQHNHFNQYVNNSSNSRRARTDGHVGSELDQYLPHGSYTTKNLSPNNIPENRPRSGCIFNTDKKLAVRRILDLPYKSLKDQAFNLFRALEIQPEIDTLPNMSGETMIRVQLTYEHSIIFIGIEETVYQNIIDYFKAML